MCLALPSLAARLQPTARASKSAATPRQCSAVWALPSYCWSPRHLLRFAHDARQERFRQILRLSASSRDSSSILRHTSSPHSSNVSAVDGGHGSVRNFTGVSAFVLESLGMTFLGSLTEVFIESGRHFRLRPIAGFTLRTLGTLRCRADREVGAVLTHGRSSETLIQRRRRAPVACAHRCAPSALPAHRRRWRCFSVARIAEGQG